MEKFKVFQDWTTVGGHADVDEICQSRQGYLDLADVSRCSVKLEFRHIGVYRFDLETAVSEEGPWAPLAQIDGWPDEPLPSFVITFLSHPAALAESDGKVQYRLLRFLRWKIVPEGGSVTFRLSYSAGTGDLA